MIDIDNEEHREALAWACSLKMCADLPRVANGTSALRAGCCKALSDPAKAAELIRQLVEMAGVSCAVTSVSSLWEHREHDIRIASTNLGRVHIANALAGDWQAMDVADVPPLILRLLSIPPGAGADAVLAALRGEA